MFAALDSFPADPSKTFAYLKGVKPGGAEDAFYAVGAAAALKHPEAQMSGQILVRLVTRSAAMIDFWSDLSLGSAAMIVCW